MTAMYEQLCEFLKGLGRPKVCVVGDLMLDAYVWGDVSRVSPEGPIPVVRVERKENRPGGAGSVAAMLSALGAEVLCVGAIGEDAEGAALKEELASRQINVEGLICCPGRPTTVKTRYMGYVQSAGRALQQIVRVDEELCDPLGEAEARQLLEQVAICADAADLLVTQDMKKGLFTRSILQEILKTAGDKGKAVLVDPELGDDYSPYAGATCIMPNRFEAQRATGLDLSSEADYAEAASRLLGELSLKAVVIKLDREGIYFATDSGQQRHITTTAREVADVTGAGDMVAAAIGLVLAGGGDYEMAVNLANIAAGMEVSRHGAATIARAELLDQLQSLLDPPARKIKTRQEIRGILDTKRQQNQRIAFTNGCFDLLHLGHISLIQYARSEGEVLVVGVNSDRSIREIKGPGRPINSEDVRTRVLAALSDVDYVVLFDEASVLPLIEQIRPDVIVKGSDYDKDGVVGAEFVESYGGEVKLAEHLPGYSTSELIRKISQNHEEADRRDPAEDRQGA